MNKIIVVLCVAVSFLVGQDTSLVDGNKSVVNQDVVANGKNEIRKQVYHENGNLRSYIISRTNLAKGTYAEYYTNGNLKVFKIVN